MERAFLSEQRGMKSRFEGVAIGNPTKEIENGSDENGWIGKKMILL